MAKVCSKCKTSYDDPQANFYKDSKGRRADGLFPQCKTCCRRKSKKWYGDNPDKAKATQESYRKHNSDKIKQINADYYLNNKEVIVEKTSKYKQDREKIDPLFRVAGKSRTFINKAISRMGYTKRSKTTEILGCSFDAFKAHIENQFYTGMSWDNYGEWHIDHKVPVSLAKTEEQVIKFNKYINLQPLWAKDNITKGNTLLEEHKELYKELTK